jgi:hypothetical protein
MELVAAVFVVVGAVIAVSVCARRATLGDEMDRSLEVLNSAPVQTLHGSTVKNPVNRFRRSARRQAILDARSAVGSHIPTELVPAQVPLAS